MRGKPHKTRSTFCLYVAEGNPVSGTHRTHAPVRRVAGIRSVSVEFDPLATAIDRTRGYLLEQQAADGHWVGELQGDTILESEYIILMAFLGREGDELVAKA